MYLHRLINSKAASDNIQTPDEGSPNRVMPKLSSGALRAAGIALLIITTMLTGLLADGNASAESSDITTPTAEEFTSSGETIRGDDGICDRSEAIQAAIIRRLGGGKTCSEVKPTDLPDIFSLHAGFASDAPMSTLQAGDLQGLDKLEDLRITNAGLHTIQSGAFEPVNDTLETVGFTGNNPRAGRPP